jgi:hypothetical protein
LSRYRSIPDSAATRAHAELMTPLPPTKRTLSLLMAYFLLRDVTFGNGEVAGR